MPRSGGNAARANGMVYGFHWGQEPYELSSIHSSTHAVSSEINAMMSIIVYMEKPCCIVFLLSQFTRAVVRTSSNNLVATKSPLRIMP